MDNQNDQNPLLSVHTPIALVALALCVLFFNQIKGSGQAYETMKWQSENAEKQIKDLKENGDKINAVIEQQKPNVAQSEQTQKQFTDLVKDLDELSRAGDKDAQQVMQIAAKAGINYTPSAAPSEPTDKKKDDKAK